MANPFDQFDAQKSGGNPFDRFDQPTAPQEFSGNSWKGFLKSELENADAGTRNIAGFGTALSNLYEGTKQLFGGGDKQQIEANKIIEEAAPVGSVLGNAAMTAIPFGLVGNSVKGAAAVGAGVNALQPADSLMERGKNAAIGGLVAGAGQKVANMSGEWLANKMQSLAAARAQKAPLQQTLQEGIDAGLVVPPSSVNPTKWNVLKEGVAGKIATAQEASNRNAAQFDNLARQAVGLSPDAPLTAESMKQLRASAYQAGYEPVANFGPIKTDEAYKKALDGIVSKYVGPAKDFPGVASSGVTDFVNGTKATKPAGSFVDDIGNIVPADLAPKAPKTRSLLDEIKKNGGLSVSEVGDVGIGGINKDYPGLLRAKGGNSGDDLVELLQSKGWISAQDVSFADANLTGGAQELARDMIRTALKREAITHPADAAAVADYQGLMRDFTQFGARKATVADMPMTGGLRVDQFDSANGIKMAQILRDEASAAFRSGDKALGKAKREAAKAIEDQIERAIASEGGAGAEAADLLNGFREARKLMAKTHTVEDAIIEGGGSVNPKKFAQMLQAGKPLSGELATIGRFANNFPKASQPAAQVAGPAVSKLNSVMAAGAAGAGALATGPLGLLAGAAPFIVPPALRAQMLSKGSQNALARQMFELGITPRVSNALLQYAPVGGTVAALESLAQ